MTGRILSDNQARLASRICTVLDGCDDDDALAALNSIVAATLVERSTSPGTALGKATAFGLQLEKTVQAGLRGALIRSDEVPIDMRCIV